ncbi:MAG: hypothetical protein RLP09_23615 [Sandaracinaceae bacterium]
MRSLLLLTLSLWLAAPTLGLAQEAPSDDAPSEDRPTRTTEEAAPGQPRYLAAMRAELEAMRADGARCEALDPQRGQCRFTARGTTTGRAFEVQLVYSDRTDTIYFYVEDYLSAPPDAGSTATVLRRLMELNWSLLIGKFEWDSTDGEVRLAIILNTDSNFDRRAFRSSVRAIGQLADRYHSELSRIARGD